MRKTTESFFAASGKMALFEVEKEGQRKAVAVKLKLYHIFPLFDGVVLTPDTDTIAETQLLIDAHPLLAESFVLFSDHGLWNTPRFRNACIGMGLDPDIIRPGFRAPFEAIAENLRCSVVERFDKKQSPVFRNEIDFLLDVLDLMRADIRPTATLLDRAREGWSKLDQSRAPQAEALARLLVTDELLCIGDEQHGTDGETGLEHVVIC